MEKLESTTWLGRVIALQGLLELVSQMSLSMQTVNVIPWELMAEQQAFYDKLVSMEASLRQRPPESDPRWTIMHPDPIPAAVFPFFHEEPDPKNHPGVTRIQMLISGSYMGQELKVPEDDRRDGITDEEAYVEAAFDLSYDISNWLQCASHFFHVRFLRDEHDILWTASKCLDLRRFAPTPGREEDDLEDIKEPLKHILRWMTKGGVPGVPDIAVVYDQALLLADIMKTDIVDFYNGCARPERACHRWHCRAEDGTYSTRSGTIIQKDIWTTPRLSSQIPAFLWVYNHCILKTANEAVVEGMCKFISKQADSVRGLSFQRYANEHYSLITLLPFGPNPQWTFHDYALTPHIPQVCKRSKNCMEWTIATRGRCIPDRMLGSLLRRREGVAFLQHRKAKANFA